MAAQNVDVVIVGAGAAGLTAAYDLNLGTNCTQDSCGQFRYVMLPNDVSGSSSCLIFAFALQD